jgi:hypothetical protein
MEPQSPFSRQYHLSVARFTPVRSDKRFDYAWRDGDYRPEIQPVTLASFQQQ